MTHEFIKQALVEGKRVLVPYIRTKAEGMLASELKDFSELGEACVAFAVLRGALGSGIAIPPLPFSPVKFSGLMERVSALDNRYRFPIFISSPLKSRFWEKMLTVNAIQKRKMKVGFKRIINKLKNYDILIFID